MADKRKRGQNFSLDEKDKLVKLLIVHKDTILNKKTDGTTNQAKNDAWIALANAFNASGATYRTKESLMKLWEKLKTEAKLYGSSIKRQHTGTGGGPSHIKTDPILIQICDIMGRGCTGIAEVDDCDADMLDVITDAHIQFENLIEDQPQPFLEIKEADQPLITQQEVSEKEVISISTPVRASGSQSSWPKRRRPSLKNERSDATSLLYSSFETVNKKKMCTEDLKRTLLEEELEFKRKLYQYQLQAAATEAEIKLEVLKQIKGGGLSLNHLFGMPKKD